MVCLDPTRRNVINNSTNNVGLTTFREIGCVHMVGLTCTAPAIHHGIGSIHSLSTVQQAGISKSPLAVVRTPQL